MVVHTANPRVLQARQAVMEFLLINHPLDCPICDEAGECKLQDYAYAHSIGYSRFEEDKVHKPKRVELGPHVMLDAERCIMCSRCVRFCDEIAGKPQLTFTQRGDHVELTTFPGEKLDNPYSMNVIDICPVGALTSREFRFKARVWEMSATETVCPGCARGCNMNIWVRNNEILRQTPRYNAEVNQYWMCDWGRLETSRQVNSDARIRGPLMRKESGVVEVGWDEAIVRRGVGTQIVPEGGDRRHWIRLRHERRQLCAPEVRTRRASDEEPGFHAARRPIAKKTSSLSARTGPPIRAGRWRSASSPASTDSSYRRNPPEYPGRLDQSASARR